MQPYASEDLDHTAVGTRFNGRNQYIVHVPEVSEKTGRPLKGKEVGYTRTSNVSKILEDANSLVNWRVRTTLMGAAKIPGIVERITELSADPEGNRAQLDALADDAYRVADGWLGAERGTALHDLLERSEMGQPMPVLLDAQLADLGAWERAKAEYGIFTVPEWAEHMIVLDEHKVAGTFDCILGINKSAYDWEPGTLRLGDYKTTKSKSIGYALGAYCIQLAVYRHGTPYRQHPEFGGRRLDWPENLDPKWAMIISLPTGEASCTLYRLDLDAGWEAAQHALWARTWRKRADIASLWLPDPTAPMVKALEESIELVLASDAVRPVERPVLTVTTGTVEQAEATAVILQFPPQPDPAEQRAVSAAEHPATLPPPPPLRITEEVSMEPFEAAWEHAQIAKEARQDARAAATAAREAALALLGGSTPAPAPAVAPEPVQPLQHELPHMAPQHGLTKPGRSMFADVLGGPPPPLPSIATVVESEPKQWGPLKVEDLTAPSPERIVLPFSLDPEDEEPAAPVPKLLAQVMSDYKLKRTEDAEPWRGQFESRMRTRLQVIVGMPNGTAIVTDAWSKVIPEVPGFADKSYLHTWEELSDIDEVLWHAEGKLGLPFPQEGYIVVADAPYVKVADDVEPPPSAWPDEQPPTPEDVEALAQAIGELPREAQQWLGAIAKAEAEAGRPIRASMSKRTWAIVWALSKITTMVDVTKDTDVMVAAMVALKIGSVGTMTVQQATDLVATIDGIGKPGGLVTEFDQSGKLSLVPF